MSKEVKRYCLSEFAEPHTYPIGPGAHVLASDYETLEAEHDTLLAERDALRDALDHIARTCRASRTSTRRTRWIERRAEWALEGKAYTDNAFDIPVDVEEKNRTLRIKKNLLAAVVRDLLDVAEGSHPNPPAAIESARAALQGAQP
ncbi:hypothetical protein [Stutzerimonas stutzeri]|uniref:hypothetical protein n=1 Tax=Stutzerimonas stutzeri TaxID=316 RepID=UPI0021FB9F52|nr:hypothetical protein [Stutzerimonas stutzeri]UVO19561.1 hypothetical protein KN217_07625 [Stutzerimonas stutzeri]